MRRMKAAFLRGINVGGRNRLPMRDLVAAIEAIGGTGVRTYLQSGNAVFEGADGDEATRLADAIEEAHGFRPLVLILDEVRLRRAVDRNPFPEAEASPKALHLFFPFGEPSPGAFEALAEVRAPSERVEIRDGIVYLHAPDGIGRSKLAARIARSLGVETTARNWRTVTRVAEMMTGDVHDHGAAARGSPDGDR